MLSFDGKPFPRNPMNKNNTPSIPDIFEEIFAPFFAEELKQTFPTRYTTMYEGQVSADGSVYTLAIEIPRMVRDTISVEIEVDPRAPYKDTRYKLVVKADQKLLHGYLFDPPKEAAKKRYEQEFMLNVSNIALDGDLTLSYTEGVLCIDIPLCKPVQPKKQTLSAKLSDMM